MAIAAILAAAAALAQSEQVFRVVGVSKGDLLNVRSEPKASASVVGKIPADATAVVGAGECKAWCRVRYGNVDGWVDRRFLAADEVPRTAIVATATSADPINDCNNEEAGPKLAGCTAILKDASAGADKLAIAASRRSDAHLVFGNLDAAIADRLKAFELSPDDPAYRLRLSHIYRQRAASWSLPGKLDAALRDYSDAIRVDPTSHESYAGRSSLYVLKDDYDSAITDLRTALSHHKGEKTVYELALARLCERRGIQHLLKKELDKAIARFTKAIELNASPDDLYMHRASAYALKDEIELALKDYSEAIRINVDSVEAYIGRGELHRRRNVLDAALADFNQAVQRQPSNITALMLSGLTREDVRDVDGAIADYQAILKFEPKHQAAKAGIVRLRVHNAVSTDGTPVASARKKAGSHEKPPAKQECFVFNDQTFCK